MRSASTITNTRRRASNGRSAACCTMRVRTSSTRISCAPRGSTHVRSGCTPDTHTPLDVLADRPRLPRSARPRTPARRAACRCRPGRGRGTRARARPRRAAPPPARCAPAAGARAPRSRPHLQPGQHVRVHFLAASGTHRCARSGPGDARPAPRTPPRPRAAAPRPRPRSDRRPARPGGCPRPPDRSPSRKVTSGHRSPVSQRFSSSTRSMPSPRAPP